MVLSSIETAFHNYLHQLGYGKSTQQMISGCVAAFLQQHKIDVAALRKEHITAFHGYLQQRPHLYSGKPLSQRYIYHHLYSLRVFFNGAAIRWLEQSGQIATNPISALKFKSPQYHPRVPLSLQQVKLLFAACRTSRELAVLHIFYSCGLRRSEGAALNAADVVPEEQLLYVRCGKFGKRRAVPLGERVANELQYYKQLAHVAADKPFLLNQNGRRMSGSSCNLLIKQLAARAELDEAVCCSLSLHLLRHSIATHLLQAGLRLEQLRDFLGHRHLEATQLYTHIDHGQLLKLQQPVVTSQTTAPTPVT